MMSFPRIDTGQEIELLDGDGVKEDSIELPGVDESTDDGGVYGRISRFETVSPQCFPLGA